ncbi:MAG: ion channel [Candidatus Heimdallarchaeota archaeon]
MADDGINWESLTVAIALFLILIFVGSYIYMLIETEAVVGSYMNAVFYVVLTVTTVGTGYYNPLTHQGQMLTIVMIMAGMGLVLYIVSAMAKVVLTRHVFLHQETTTSVSPSRLKKLRLARRKRL